MESQSPVVYNDVPVKKGPPRKWLMDRINGQSKYNDCERPPGPCCWVPPCVGWCPALLETNILCKSFGKMGIYGSERFRFLVLHLGFVANILAMLATAYAALSISLEFFLLSKSAMGVIEVEEQTDRVFSDPACIYLGLRGVGFDDPNRAETSLVQYMVVGYDDLCLVADTSAAFYFDSTKDCESCNSDYFSMNAVISLMIAVTLFFPTFFSEQLRMYSGYDTNCVKNFLSILGWLIILLELNVMLTYIYFCGKESFYQEPEVFFDVKGNPTSSEEDAYVVMKYTWSWGWAFIALIAGMGLKLIDLLCNIAVPTPKVTRDLKEQELYEAIVYVDPDEAGTDEEN